MPELKLPQSDAEDLAAVRSIGSGKVNVIKALSEWMATGMLISEIARKRNVSSQYLEEYWIKNTTEEFRLKTQRLQGDAFWDKALQVMLTESKNKHSSARSRSRAKLLSAEYKATAKLLHPEKWDPSMARKIAKAKSDGVKGKDGIAFGIDQDFGDDIDTSHIRVVKGGVTHDLAPRYDDQFSEDTYDPRKKLTSRIVGKRRNPFDTLDWKKLVKAHVK